MSRSKYLTLLVAGSIGLLSACGPKAPAGAGDAPPAEVGVVVVGESSATITSELPGRTSAYRKAEVRPQVSGIIQKRLFTEGAEVKAGTQLYQIDPASYEAALSSAEADLSRAQANFTTAKARHNRVQSLGASKVISQQDLDDSVAALAQAQSGVEIAKASAENARINLKYTKVLAPISGVIGKSSVTEGALVSAGQAQVLATIQQLDPIYVDVSQSVDEMLKLRRQIKNGKLSAPGEAKVKLLLSDSSPYVQEGRLQFSEVGVSETTGTVVLRALFPNPDKLLLPGMFVRAELQDGVHAKAILIPQQGVTRDRSGGATTLVVNKESKVELRPIKTSTTLGDKWLVEEGLAVGEQVIVEGLQKAKPGATVKAVPAKIATKTGE
ncbi:MexX family efflux pump subunit [Cellvibrio zantedeschiae]|uniref:MexX family efflux pump subunit n=1 Tax=Cellvibrio zantedeschiae TaxID=1237077 RepID=A0ABQ3B3N9_9GAMM|nr:efflux RND transporter periplasmic adaptor subunit [Cellvibrio zantedeschiae]GGY77953.1 MexX family efflux pump subunit [Cellvibrio zantedeschiae]